MYIKFLKSLLQLWSLELIKKLSFIGIYENLLEQLMLFVTFGLELNVMERDGCYFKFIFFLAYS